MQRVDTRQTILSVARDLFMEQGYEAVTTRHIAKLCGITQPALYRHFADKKQLYIAVLLEELEGMHASLTRVIAKGTDTRGRLLQIALYIADIKADTTIMFYDMTHQLDEDTRERLNRAFFEKVIGPIAAVFGEAVKTSAGFDAVTASFLFLGLLSNKNAPHMRLDPARRAQMLVTLMLDGIGGPS